ncbi:MAG: helix-turn-helix domain-containing protein [Turicibacter sp.]|nr:helix-turn-helix domain-containing protein [Turicibacter sp.]
MQQNKILNSKNGQWELFFANATQAWYDDYSTEAESCAVFGVECSDSEHPNDMNILEDIRHRIIKIRYDHDYTQKDVAKKSGIKFGTYRKIESGSRSTICVREVLQLCKAYKLVSADYFLFGKKPE